MPTPQQQQMLWKHAIERLELSVTQARDWVTFYQEYGPTDSLHHWELTLDYRIKLLEAHAESASAATAAESAPGTTTA